MLQICRKGALDGKTGLFSWTPHYFTAGDYPDVVFTASDGNLASSGALTLHVQRVDRTPVFVPMAPQSGRENADLKFTGWPASDGDPVVFSALSAPPDRIQPNHRCVRLDPNLTRPSIHLAVRRDRCRGFKRLDVNVIITNIDRSPTITSSNHQVMRTARVQAQRC